MTESENNIRLFDVLYLKKDMFSITSGLILANLCLIQGVQETIDKNRWYAQISDCIIRGEIDYVTEVERVEFIKMHKMFVSQLKTTI